MRAITTALAGLVCAFVAFGQPSVKPRIAVKTFENPTAYYNSTIGNALTEILVTELAKTGKYALVERQAVDELLKEIHLGDERVGQESNVRSNWSTLGRRILADRESH